MTIRTMKAVAFETFGEAEVLMTKTLSMPTINAGEVLIRLEHTSVNPVDWKIRKGYLKDMLPHRFPIIPGWDASGVVEQVASDVTAFKPGDRVAAYARLPEVHSGTYAEYIALPASYLAKIGTGVSTEQAATVPLVALTAFQALTEFSRVQPNQEVLVLNGAGGVGSFAIQLAKQLGARVTTTTSSKNVDYVKSLGADQIINYSSEQLVTAAKRAAPQGFDFVLDAIGGESLQQSYNLLRRGGQLVSIVDTPDAELARSLGIQASFHFVNPNGQQLQGIFDSINSGSVKIPAYSVRLITEAAEAHIASEKHHVRGKIVLKIQF